MISSAIVQSATVLMNRRTNAERDVVTFVPVCSRVTGMHLHHPQGTKLAQAQISRAFRSPIDLFVPSTRHLARLPFLAPEFHGSTVHIVAPGAFASASTRTLFTVRVRRRWRRRALCVVSDAAVISADHCNGGPAREKCDSQK